MNTEILETIKKKLSPKTIALIVLAVVVLIAAITGIQYLRWYLSPEQTAIRDMEAGDYDAVFNSIEEVRDSESLAAFTIQRLEELKQSFLAEKIEYNAACTELDTIRAMGITGVLETLNNVQEFIINLNNSRTYFDTAEEFRSAGNYEQALYYYAMVSIDDPDHAIASSRINECTNMYREYMLNEAARLSAADSYAEAISILEEALTILPADARITGQITLYRAELAAKTKSDTLAEAKAYADKEDYANAIRTISPLYTQDPTDAQLSVAYEEYCQKYQNQVLTMAESLALEKKYDEAIYQINVGLKQLPDNQVLKDKIAALEAAKPVSLSSFGTINGGWSWNEGTPMDPFGNDYSGSANFTIHTNHSRYSDPITEYAEYRLYGKYTTLTGTLAPYTSIGQFGTWYIQVYTDDGTNNEVLVYTSPEIGRKTDAYEFTANIAGANYVKICIVLGDEAASIVCNLKVWPQ